MHPERDLEKGDVDPQDDIDVTPKSTESVTALTKEPDITAHVAPCANSEDVLKIPHRGRRASTTTNVSSNGSDTTQPDDHGPRASTQRDHSRAHSSARSIRRDVVKVPVNERRGILGRFALIPEVTNPYDYPRKVKWLLTLIIAVAGAAAPMASSIVLPALVDIANYFNTTATVVNLSVALYMLSMAIMPLWWSSFSETLGRRTIYLISFTLYVLFSILGAVSTSIGMFLAMRMLSGAAGASVQAVGAGTIADIWEVKERGRAIGMFYLGPLCGPLLAPIIGGVLNQFLGWRSVQWFLAILGGLILLFLVFALPETLKRRKSVAEIAEEEARERATQREKDDTADTVRPTLTRTTTRQSVQIKTSKYIIVLRRSLIDPLRIILYLQFPAVAVCVFYATVTFAGLYTLNLSVQQTFSVEPYKYKSIIIGLLYTPNSAGYFVTSIWGGKWVDGIMAREARKAGRIDSHGKLQYQPEDRMKENVWIAGIMFPAALIVYGWTAQYGVNLAVPMIANFFFGIGSMLYVLSKASIKEPALTTYSIFAAVTTMLTEFMPRKASNGVALNNFVRNTFSCVASAVTDPLIKAIGNGWLFTIYGVTSLVSGVCVILAMKRFGPRWRIVMDQNIDRVQGR